MKKLGNLVLGLVILGATVVAQSPPGVATESTKKAVPASFGAILTKTLDARKSQVGDIVIARTSDDISLRPDVQIPKNAKLIGRITQVQAKGRGSPDSRIGVVFEKAVMRDGREEPLSVAIESVLSSADPGFANESRLGAASFADSSSLKDIQIEIASDSGRAVSVLHSKGSNLRVESGARLMLTIIEK